MNSHASDPGSLRLGIVCGGPSPEHAISLLSSRNILAGARTAGFQTTVIGVDRDGQWHAYGDRDHLVHPEDPDRVALAPGGRPVMPARTVDGGRLLPLQDRGEPVALDLAFPVMHGPYGEDGTVQAVLEATRIPYVGSGVAASAVCMDKDLTKTVLRAAGQPVVDWVAVPRRDLDRAGIDSLTEALGPLPWYVKPACMGSSVGIGRVAVPEELESALIHAFEYDDKVLVEKAVAGRELECAVLGNDAPEASGVGEIEVKHRDGFYSYAVKYLEPDGASLHLDAALAPADRERVRALAVDAFLALGCRGLARVDFFLSADGALFVNELNTMPGFTRISMYPKLWERAGLPLDRLITRLVDLAME